jgi:uncharacterized phage protein gp47/JayE
MAFPVRSLAEISQTVRGAIRQYLPGTDASLKQNVLYVIGKVITLLAGEYELRLAWLYDQLFLSTATSEAIVRQQAAEYGITQKPASPAAGSISGTAAANITYPAGVRWISGAATYVATAPFTADALGRFSAMVRAERPGEATNREAGALLTLVDVGLYPAMTATATVDTDGLGGGADVETVEALRTRALKRKRTPPQGGALSDYERFALEVPGVAAAWARQFTNGFGTVGAWVLFASRPAGIPTEADLDAVQAYVEERRLVRADFIAAAPRPSAVDVTLALSPDSAAARTAVAAALAALFDATADGARIRPGLPGDDFILPIAWISEAISTTPGEDRHRLVAPAGDITFAAGDMPVLGAITWVA